MRSSAKSLGFEVTYLVNSDMSNWNAYPKTCVSQSDIQRNENANFFVGNFGLSTIWGLVVYDLFQLIFYEDRIFSFPERRTPTWSTHTPKSNLNSIPGICEFTVLFSCECFENVGVLGI